MTVNGVTFEIGSMIAHCYIEYSVTRYYSATYWEPAEGGEIQEETVYIERVTKDGIEVKLSDEQIKKIERFLNKRDLYEICNAHCEKNYDPYDYA